MRYREFLAKGMGHHQCPGGKRFCNRHGLRYMKHCELLQWRLTSVGEANGFHTTCELVGSPCQLECFRPVQL